MQLSDPNETSWVKRSRGDSRTRASSLEVQVVTLKSLRFDSLPRQVGQDLE